MASQPAAGTPDVECLEVPSFVRGYHAYRHIWEPENGEILPLKRERENCKGVNAVAVVKDGRTVGHVPRNVAPHFTFYQGRNTTESGSLAIVLCNTVLKLCGKVHPWH